MNKIIEIISQYSIFIVIGLIIITVLLLIMNLILLSSVNKLEKKYRKMMRGVNNKNLEDIEKALEKSEMAMNECKNLSEEMKGCVNKIAIMRYKAFEDIGSDLSFSVAILDSFNDGVIITGIYSRRDSTTYAKPIDKGISRYDLSEEEIHVLNEAINSKN